MCHAYKELYILNHGNYSFEIDNNLIIFSLAGDFNEHGMFACLDAERKAIEKFSDEKCFLLVDCTKITGATPEAYRAVDNFYNEINYKYLAAIAVIHDSHLLTQIQHKNIPQMKKHNVREFLDRKSAISWLKSH